MSYFDSWLICYQSIRHNSLKEPLSSLQTCALLIYFHSFHMHQTENTIQEMYRLNLIKPSSTPNKPSTNEKKLVNKLSNCKLLAVCRNVCSHYSQIKCSIVQILHYLYLINANNILDTKTTLFHLQRNTINKEFTWFERNPGTSWNTINVSFRDYLSRYRQIWIWLLSWSHFS